STAKCRASATVGASAGNHSCLSASSSGWERTTSSAVSSSATPGTARLATSRIWWTSLSATSRTRDRSCSSPASMSTVPSYDRRATRPSVYSSSVAPGGSVSSPCRYTQSPGTPLGLTPSSLSRIAMSRSSTLPPQISSGGWWPALAYVSSRDQASYAMYKQLTLGTQVLPSPSGRPNWRTHSSSSRRISAGSRSAWA